MRQFRVYMGFLIALAMVALVSCGDPQDPPVSEEQTAVSVAGDSLAEESVESSASDADPASEPEGSEASSVPDVEASSEPEHTHVFEGATCTEAGICECGAVDVALGHDFTEATCTEPAVCTRCGETGDDALGHSLTAATCTEPAVCTRCGETDGAALGHDNAGATCEEPGACSRCGAKGSALGHEFADATCTAPSTCKRCGATKGSAQGHTYSGGKCKRCGDTNGPLSPEEAKLFKNKLTDEENAQALAVARKLVEQINKELPNGSDFDRIAMAAELVSAEYYRGVHVESGNYYHTAYGVFVKRESSCAGCCRALGLVLSCMGYQWTHMNENQWTHQWITVDIGGETIWADGQVGWTGYGEHPMAGW